MGRFAYFRGSVPFQTSYEGQIMRNLEVIPAKGMIELRSIMHTENTHLKRPTAPDRYAKVLGSPGEAPRFTGWLRVLWPFFLLMWAAGYLVRAAWPQPALSSVVIGVGFLLLAGVLAWSLTLGRQRLESFIKGARGEEWVARVLSYLPASYSVYHGVPAPARWRGGPGDYDHVVIGPSGLFLVETKHWKGRLTVKDGEILYDGKRPDRNPLDQVKAAAAQLRAELSDAFHTNLDVQPVLCFAGGALAVGRTGASGVMICTAQTLNEGILDSSEEPLPRDVQLQIAGYVEQRMSQEGSLP